VVKGISGGVRIYFAGIDIGSTVTKAVIINPAGDLCSSVIGPTGVEHRRLADEVLNKALKEVNLRSNDVVSVTATGYGRISVPFADQEITELTCHARGVLDFFPEAATVIDIGGQDAKGLKIKNGKLVKFVMNDRCAAGTGRFLEILSKTLGLNLDDLGEISSKSVQTITISNVCTVFAQQEIMSCLADGISLPDIVAGVHEAIAARVCRMVKKLKVESPVVFTGGVARNSGMVAAMKRCLGIDILVPETPMLTGAIGAAILGRDRYIKVPENVPCIR
jgi:predicted CoA-substrate-specific enzyme activase